MRLTPAGPAGVNVAPREFPTNRGGLCQKGWTSAELLRHPERLTSPLLHGRPVSWNTALDFVADRIRALQAAHGPDAIAMFGGGGLTNEKCYLLGKFARVALRTSQIDYNGRFCMSSAAAAGNAAFGVDRGLPFPVTDLADSDVVLLVGANVAETMPPFVSHLRGVPQIVVDPRRSATADAAVTAGGLHLALRPGSDAVLAIGMLHAAVADALIDRDYIEARTVGFADAWQEAAQYWPEHTERITGVSAADIRATVHRLAEAERAYILTARGTEQHATGVATVRAWINLALALGLPGRDGSGFGTITGQGNGQGGREHGQKADQLPGYRLIDDPAARAHVAGVWGVDPASLPGPGRSAAELLDALGTPDGPKALLVFGANVLVSAPRVGVVAERLAALDLLVVADIVPSETAVRADIVLPVTQWAEEGGTMTNLEGRVLLRRPAIPPPRGVRSDLEVLQGLAVRLGQSPSRFPTEPEVVFDELCRASAGGRSDYAGMTYERLAAGEALHWPCPTADHPGTPRLFLDRFFHADGKARFGVINPSGPAEQPDEAYPLYATTGRILAHYQSGAQTRRVSELAATVDEAFVEVHPDTAARHGLVEAGLAVVRSRRGSTVARVRLDPSMRHDTVFLPFHFPGEGAANLITNPALDPTSRMPEFKVCAVRLDPA
jgi:assimilatory nitrate reductase catalytic subunit